MNITSQLLNCIPWLMANSKGSFTTLSTCDATFGKLCTCTPRSLSSATLPMPTVHYERPSVFRDNHFQSIILHILMIANLQIMPCTFSSNLWIKMINGPNTDPWGSSLITSLKITSTNNSLLPTMSQLCIQLASSPWILCHLTFQSSLRYGGLTKALPCRQPYLVKLLGHFLKKTQSDSWDAISHAQTNPRLSKCMCISSLHFPTAHASLTDLWFPDFSVCFF